MPAGITENGIVDEHGNPIPTIMTEMSIIVDGEQIRIKDEKGIIIERGDDGLPIIRAETVEIKDLRHHLS